MDDSSGYRLKRLREHRRRKVARWQLWTLYVLAAVVALVAVLGALALSRWLAERDRPEPPFGYVAALSLGVGEAGRRPTALLALRDPRDDGFRAWSIPRLLLLEGPQGEYVLAEDDFGTRYFEGDLGRVLRTPVRHSFRLPYETLAELAGDEAVRVSLGAPIDVELDGVKRRFEGDFSVPVERVPDLLSASTLTGEGEGTLGDAVLRGVFDAAGARPQAERAAAVERVLAMSSAGDARVLRDALTALTEQPPFLTRVPSTPRTAEDQYALVPDPSGIQAEITRRAPGYRARYTVQVQNGSGRLGVGEKVAKQLTVLDVNLPTPVNADSFDYRHTQILAGAEALAVARDVRAILRRGVVLRGEGLAPTTVVVIVGSDLTKKDLQ